MLEELLWWVTLSVFDIKNYWRKVLIQRPLLEINVKQLLLKKLKFLFNVICWRLMWKNYN